MRLISEGRRDNWTVFRQREAGVPWSKIRDEAPTQALKVTYFGLFIALEHELRIE